MATGLVDGNSAIIIIRITIIGTLCNMPVIPHI